MDFGPQQIGKWLIVSGLGIVLPGKVGLFRLPGDLQFVWMLSGQQAPMPAHFLWLG